MSNYSRLLDLYYYYNSLAGGFEDILHEDFEFFKNYSYRPDEEEYPFEIVRMNQYQKCPTGNMALGSIAVPRPLLNVKRVRLYDETTDEDS